MEDIKEIRYKDYTAKINLSRGANCIELKNSKYNASVLRVPDYSRKLDNPYLYGMPILFPVNRISGGKFIFEDREYDFGINEENTGCFLHGIIHDTPFSIKEHKENKIVCELSKNPYPGFPHEFSITMEYELNEEGFLHKTSITNLSDENMPAFLGFHTTFNINVFNSDNADNVKVLAEVSKEYERNMKNYLPTGNRPEFDLVSKELNSGRFKPITKPISRHYMAQKGGVMKIADESKNLSVVYENDEKFGFRLIYCGGTEGYICLEPQNVLANCANSPIPRDEAGFFYIEPKKTEIFNSKIYIREEIKK